MKPRFFASPEKFRAWLAANHAKRSELLVGFYKKSAGRPSIDWPQSVDEALCYGWIDGIRRSLGEESYTIRFTPRRPGSIWSSINIRRVAALKRVGRMQPAGLAAFARRSRDRSAVYAYEQRASATLAAAELRVFKANRAAWQYFSSLAPSYRHKALYWITSSRKPETRRSRLERLIAMATKKQKL
ncbi:MAG TPA: YdeI/OmpD-associated family protein [Steroidobacteraceae bacterium]|nr:YdeI/OmpD-associated family protein [Steroidobacteraceae bacterium]